MLVSGAGYAYRINGLILSLAARHAVAEPKAAKRAPKGEGKPRRKKKAAAEPRSRGIAPDAIGEGTPPPALGELAKQIQTDGGTVLAPYKDPLGGNWQLFAALPIDLVEPTPYQRDLSKPHVERLSSAMDRLGRYLDPMTGKDEWRFIHVGPNGEFTDSKVVKATNPLGKDGKRTNCAHPEAVGQPPHPRHLA